MSCGGRVCDIYVVVEHVSRLRRERISTLVRIPGFAMTQSRVDIPCHLHQSLRVDVTKHEICHDSHSTSL